MTRRQMLSLTSAAVAGSALAAPKTRMTIQLDCGAIGVKATMEQVLDYARRFGFQSISADTAWLAARSDDELKRFLDAMRASLIVWGSGGFGTDFRSTDEAFATGLKTLPAAARALQRAGVGRTSTWISPTSDSVTYVENFRLHASRLRQCATILGDYGIRLGLEYVGPKTSWTARRHPFIHSMREMRELISEIGRPNVGLLLDSWHWFTAGEGAAELQTLTNQDIVSVDLNDAPAGVPLDQQKDNQRELPAATGVIPVAAFLNALSALGCDAPVRCEPFNAALRALPPEEALAATAAAMKKAFATIA